VDLTNTPTLVLASQSPRRAELIGRLGLKFITRPAYIDEEALGHLPPDQMALQLAQAKAQAAWQAGEWVLGADTVVALGDQVLGKPADPAENRVFLQQLSGRSHVVYTGLALVQPSGLVHAEVAQAEVQFRTLSEWEIAWYAASGEGLDKAGGYGAQGLGMVLLEGIRGDFYTVMGLPVSRVWQVLSGLKFFGEPSHPGIL
jgi:septum formation protein